MKKIGIVGCSGRMGKLLQQEIAKHKNFTTGLGFSKSQSKGSSLSLVFSENDYVVDFSKPELLPLILEGLTHAPKPLVICSTGWSGKDLWKAVKQAAAKAPIVIAPNTSLGVSIQRHLVREVAKLLGSDYDIDILEKHHGNKVDAPSGTASALIQDIQGVKQQQGLKYNVSTFEKGGARSNPSIGLSIQRAGNIPGHHEVSFTSADEMISIKHVAFDRALFAQGAVRVLEWLSQGAASQPGLYSMADVLKVGE